MFLLMTVAQKDLYFLQKFVLKNYITAPFLSQLLPYRRSQNINYIYERISEPKKLIFMKDITHYIYEIASIVDLRIDTSKMLAQI